MVDKGTVLKIFVFLLLLFLNNIDSFWRPFTLNLLESRTPLKEKI